MLKINNIYVNSVPSQTGDSLEGQTTRTYDLNEIMKSVPLLRNSSMGSAVLLLR